MHINIDTIYGWMYDMNHDIILRGKMKINTTNIYCLINKYWIVFQFKEKTLR